MVPQTAQPVTSARENVPTKPGRLTGKVVYMYAFDVAYELLRYPLRELLGQPVAQFAVDASKRAPRHLFFHRPQMVRLPPLEKIGPHGLTRIEWTVKVLSVGAISVTASLSFDVDQLDKLVEYHDMRFADGRTLYEEARDLAEQVRQALAPYFVRPHPTLGDEEAYTVFCINGPIAGNDGKPRVAEEWLLANRRQVAAVLTEESDPDYLSDQEADESSAKYFSYSQTDLVVVDWDAAMVVDEPQHFDEVLYIMELANLQLAELEAYDRLLDDAVERSYRDMNLRGLKSWIRPVRNPELREIRVDLARLSDELQNITKFFGDWHLARIYQGIAARFHLPDWHRSIDGKLKTLDDLYQILHLDRTNKWMLLLETMIVLLFIIEIVKSIFGW